MVEGREGLLGDGVVLVDEQFRLSPELQGQTPNLRRKSIERLPDESTGAHDERVSCAQEVRPTRSKVAQRSAVEAYHLGSELGGLGPWLDLITVGFEVLGEVVGVGTQVAIPGRLPLRAGPDVLLAPVAVSTCVHEVVVARRPTDVHRAMVVDLKSETLSFPLRNRAVSA